MAASANQRASTWRSWLDTASGIAVLIGSAAVVWKVFFEPAGVDPRRRVPLPKEPVSIEGSFVKGNRTAKVAVIEYSDFQCPYCRQFARTLFGDIDKRYLATGRVLFAFRHLPSTNHSFAMRAAEAAECAGDQGKFWEMHDALFERQPSQGGWDLHAVAVQIGLAESAFAICLDGRKKDKIDKQLAESAALEITGTPTFLIGTLTADGKVRITDRFSGATQGQIERVLDKLLGL